MSFSRFAIEKKMVSTDRGVTWKDVTPSETRNGRLIGVARTLIECEDLDCDLEKWGVQLVDESIPTSICTKTESTSTYLPSGIAKHVKFTAGMACCINAWGSSNNRIIDEYNNASIALPTATITTGWNPIQEYNEYDLDGREMYSGNFCGNPTCYDITEFMPWIDPNDTIKMAYKIHYVREHCSNEWHIDEEYEPKFVTFGERWVKTYEDIYKATWQHQIATDIIFEGFGQDNVPYQVVWEDEGEPFDYYYEVTIPEDITPLEYIMADGVAANPSGWIDTYQVKLKAEDPEIYGFPSGAVASKKYRTCQSYGSWDCTYPEDKRWNDNGTLIYDFKEFSPGVWKTVIIDICERTESGRALENIGGFLCEANPIFDGCSITGYTVAGGVLNNIKIGGFIKPNDNIFYFPYKIYSNNGWDDEYYNGSEYGLIDRNGNKIVLEYVYGKYTNTSGVTQNIRSDAASTISIPSDAVDVTLSDSITSIPNNLFDGNTALTSVTMNNVTAIGTYAFRGCTNLESFTLRKSNVALGDAAFSGSGLKDIDLTNVGNMRSSVFSNCTSLSSITFGNIGGLPDSAFEGCTSITSIDIPSSLRTIGRFAFWNTSLSSVTLNEGLEYLGAYTFSNLTGITEITIPSTVSGYGSSVFRNCRNLTNVTIKTTATIGEGVFYDCNLKYLTITTTTPPLVRNGRAIWDGVFSFAQDAVILVPASAVDTYKNDGGNEGWHNVANMIYPIPNETEWVNIGYACVDGQRYDYERKRGRNTEYSNDWFWLPEYRTVGEPYGECDGSEPY